MGAGRGRSCRAQETLLGMVPAAAARAAEVPGPGSGALPAPGPLAPPRPGSRRASGSLAAAGARLQRQRGPPGFVSVGVGVFCPGSAPLKNGREEREADTSPSLHLLDRGVPPSPPLSPSGSPRPSLLPLPSLSPLGSPRFSPVSRYCLCLGRGGGRGDDSQRGRKFLGVFSFPLSLQSGLRACATSDLLGAPRTSLS